MRFEKGTTSKARKKALSWLKTTFPSHYEYLSIGLPEYDDRLDFWRISINTKNSKLVLIGEIKLDRAVKNVVDFTKKEIILDRIEKFKNQPTKNKSIKNKKQLFYPAPIPNKIIWGDAIKVLDDFPPDTAQLVITSPPYYNAKPQYSEYVDYQEYLDFLRKVFLRCHNVLSEGRFFVVNISPVLIKRTSRNTSSTRIALPFDIHRILDSIGFDFIDDIMWVKPEGAGWNLGRGRRFRADRQPLQYKPVPVTEYILVYRKKTDKLIDWNIRNHYDSSLVKRSKVKGDYDVTNLWHIHPSTNKIHPATFPDELVRRVIRYYSFEGDLVLDPFGGSGTVARVAHQMHRRFLLIDKEHKYFELMRKDISKVVGNDARVDFDIHDEFKEE
ncbi:MAG: site-specific DNA-methyltransferase [Bacteroidetes bacterium]|nr:site-specific DNA-methyltransferase [Bacteroidota bacterium]